MKEEKLSSAIISEVRETQVRNGEAHNMMTQQKVKTSCCIPFRVVTQVSHHGRQREKKKDTSKMSLSQFLAAVILLAHEALGYLQMCFMGGCPE